MSGTSLRQEELGGPGELPTDTVDANREKSSALLTEWQSAVSAGTETLINFDCTEARETCQESGVQAYPEIHLFQGGKRISRYDGPRRDSA